MSKGPGQEENSQSKLFRKEALDRLSSPEHLDQLMQVVTLKDWIPLVTLGGLIFVAGAWSVFGKIPITVMGQGLIIRPRQLVDFQSTQSGQLQTIEVETGQCIPKDYVVATIDPTLLEVQWQLQQTHFEQLRSQSQALNVVTRQRAELDRNEIESTQYSLEQRLAAEQLQEKVLQEQTVVALTQERASVEQQLHDAQALTPVLQERYERRRDMAEVGAVSEDVVLQAERDYRNSTQQISQLTADLEQLDLQEVSAEQQLAETRGQISDIQAQLMSLATRRKALEEEELDMTNQRQNQVDLAKRELATLEQQLGDAREILSPQAGCVVEVTAQVGQNVTPGTRLGSLEIEDSAKSVQAVTFFDIGDGKRISPGMTIQVTPDTVKRERFGGIVGEVVEVSAYPNTREAASILSGNPDIVHDLLGPNTSTIAVISTLQLDPTTVSGYQWSSSQGPAMPISTGTTTQVRVRVEERTPISFALPLLREWSGL